MLLLLLAIVAESKATLAEKKQTLAEKKQLAKNFC
jgi:hypothetical protein